MSKRLAFYFVLPFLAFSLHAQDQSQESLPGVNQNQTNAVDCSDPMMAGTAQCTGQLQGSNPLSNMGIGTIPGMMPNSLQQQYGNYTDNEILTRQLAARALLRPLPPEPLTEFQKFVASTTGQVLPIYGANLFRQVPSTFSPLDLSPVPPDYVIGPGDELRVRVWGQVNFRADVRVDRSGEIYLPQVGGVHVAGLPFSGLDQHLRDAISRIYRNFDLTADVGQIRSIQVYVAGAARRPGVYTVSSLSTLVDALFASGGPSPSGSLRHIEVRRNGAVVTDFDLYALLIRGDKSKDVPLESGDVIFIPPVGAEVAASGSVRNPAIYEIREGETLADLIADAGGAAATAAETRVTIERVDEHRDRLTMEVAYDKTGMTTPMADGDLIRLYSILPKYQKTVTLRGNTANPGHFAWKPGMHLSDLIPDKDSLVTRNYWWKRAQLGIPGPEFEPLRYFPNLRQPNYPVDLPRRQLMGQPPPPRRPVTRGNTSNGATPNTQEQNTQDNNYNYNDQYGYDQYGYDQNGYDQNGYDQYYGQYPYDQSTADQGYPDENYGDNGTAQQQTGANPSGSPNNPQAPGATPQMQQSSSSLASNETAPTGRFPTTPRTQVGPVAPDIDWDYAVIERLDPKTLKTSLIPFDLGKLILQHDSSQDLALEPGDVVSVFSQADIRVPLTQQTKFVRLEGEFAHSGVYTVKPGETLRDLVQEAGGLAPNAYLYGSEFTRESTRVVQQHRLDEYLQSLELQIQRGNLAIAASPVSSAQDIASGSAAQTSEQQLLTQLRQMRATGRIVLEFRPGSTGIDAVPAIPLEDGDRFVVPPTPSSVNVVGSVYDQNSFLFENTRRAGTYLRLAGGPNRDADQKHIFIIRADGSVVSREAESGIWGNEFNTLHMSPGDTIVVPEKTFKPSALRGFLDWSQLFSQFAFGAAAISVIQ